MSSVDPSRSVSRWRRLARVSMLGASIASAGLLLRFTGRDAPETVRPPVPSSSSAAGSLLVRRLGLHLHELDATAHRAGFHGLMVDAVQGVAARAGVQVGDCIVQANGEPVDTADDLSRHLPDDARSVGLLLRRGERHVFVPIQLSS